LKIDKLIDALGQIDESKIENAKLALPKPNHFAWKHFIACAAALALILGIGIWKSDWFYSSLSILGHPPLISEDPVQELPPTQELPPITQELPPITEEKTTLRGVVLLSSIQNGETHETILKTNLQVPLQYQINVTDIRGVEKSKIGELLETEKQKLQVELDKIYLKNIPTGSVGNVGVWENAMIRTLKVGFFKLKTADSEIVKSIIVESNTDFGEVEFLLWSDSVDASKRSFHAIHGSKISLDGETYAKIAQEELEGKGSFEIGWKHSKKVIEAINENPSIDLSTFSDTMKISIEYKDGKTECFEFEIQFERNGSVKVLQKDSAKNI